MIRKLFILAGAGLVLGVVCLAGTAVLVRHDLEGQGINITSRHMDNDFHISPAAKVTPQPEITVTRDFKITDSLGIDLPADVEYVQGPKASVTLTGSKNLVEQVRTEGGRLFLDHGADTRKAVNLRLVDGHIKSTTVNGQLKVIVTAPSVKQFDLSGAGDLDLSGYDQPELTLRISGAGNVSGKGKTTKLRLDISGAGNADLEDLKTVDADVRVSGLGNADIRASGAVTASISGAGNITLVERPASLSQNVSGIGRIEVAD